MAKVNENFLNALPAQEHEYFYTHFKIEAGYQWGSGMEANARDTFFDEMKALFSAAGWAVEEAKFSGSCPTVHKGGNRLYCHPMELSGPCVRTLHDEVTAIVAQANSCFLRQIETYKRVYDLSDEQYKEALDSVREDVERDLLKAFTTDRKDRYVNGCYTVLDDVSESYRVPTLKRTLGISSGDVHCQYISDVFQDLVKEGKILSRENARGGMAYRTAPEHEPKAKPTWEEFETNCLAKVLDQDPFYEYVSLDLAKKVIRIVEQDLDDPLPPKLDDAFRSALMEADIRACTRSTYSLAKDLFRKFTNEMCLAETQLAQKPFAQTLQSAQKRAAEQAGKGSAHAPEKNRSRDMSEIF